MPKLDIYDAGGSSHEYIFPDSDLLTIGRTHANDIVLPDKSRKVSRCHAAIVRVHTGASGYFVRDLGSLHGIRVAGIPVYQRVLSDRDVIQIGGYQLTYTARPETSKRFHHLRVASTGQDDRYRESSTLAFKLSAIQGYETQFSEEPRELLEMLHHRLQRESPLEQFAEEIMAAALRVVRADNGLVCLFDREDPTNYQELAAVNLEKREAIDISDHDFVEHLRAGNVVQEAHTVLVPISNREGVKGFLCAHRRDRGNTFSADEVGFLVNVGKLMLPDREHEKNNPSHASAATEPIEWPIELVGQSAPMGKLSKQISIAAETSMNVLISGETGSGKELIAQAIHWRGANSRGPFVAKNCGQITESLAETAIFGYSPKSGIAGAKPEGAPGWFELADGGTLFLDEIHCLSESMQDKFLRVLQDKEVWRFGARSAVSVNVKVVAATDQNLEEAIEEGRIRSPFYYRFGMRIQVPALRDRREDIPLLVFYFLDKYAHQARSRARTVSHRAMRRLVEYEWPGNVRQLGNVIQAGVAKGQEVLFSWDLLDDLAQEKQRSESLTAVHPQTALQHPRSMVETEKEKIKEALEVTHGNVTRAAQLLGFKSRQTILNKMDRYAIPRNYADPQLPGSVL